MLSIIYLVQIIMSLFVYYVHMRKLTTLNLIYKNTDYLKIGTTLALIYIICFVFFGANNICITYPFTTFFSFMYFKKFYKNFIMENDDYLYNGVSLMKKSGIKKVFIEKGSNLEKKYNVKYIGIDKYKKSEYIIFESTSNVYSLVKGYDDTYLNIIKNKFL